MTPPLENKVRVVRFFMGTRADLTPRPLRGPVFVWDCTKCQAKTYSVGNPPRDQTRICNVCASRQTAQAAQDSSTHVIWGMNKELEESVNNIADKKKRPAEEVFNRFLEWKLGRLMNTTRTDQPDEKKPQD